eukprot:jgi/Psemu1/218082/e_gw1.887.31.1
MRTLSLSTITLLALTITGTNSLSRHAAMKMPLTNTGPPLDSRRHTSDFSARKNHPTSYDSSPNFKGPLTLSRSFSTSDHRVRIQNFYEKNPQLQPESDREPCLPLNPTAKTGLILKTIMDHFAFHDAPVDAKEMAESIEFYLRTLVQVFDMCAGHGLTGMLFAACNPPRMLQTNRMRIVQTHLVDVVEPPSHTALRELIADVCPWIKENIYFHACTLEELNTNSNRSRNSPTEGTNDDDVSVAMDAVGCSIVIATHACGKLTDQVLDQAVNMNACAIAAMPCCYTGTDKGVPYGIKRALGVAWAADIRRTQFLDDNQYHVDYATIPAEITPLNRIIMAEERL